MSFPSFVSFVVFYAMMIAAGQIVGVFASLFWEGVKDIGILKWRGKFVSDVESHLFYTSIAPLLFFIALIGLAALIGIDRVDVEDKLLMLTGLLSCWLCVRRLGDNPTQTAGEWDDRFGEFMETYFAASIERVLDRIYQYRAR